MKEDYSKRTLIFSLLVVNLILTQLVVEHISDKAHVQLLFSGTVDMLRVLLVGRVGTQDLFEPSHPNWQYKSMLDKLKSCRIWFTHDCRTTSFFSEQIILIWNLCNGGVRKYLSRSI